MEQSLAGTYQHSELQGSVSSPQGISPAVSAAATIPFDQAPPLCEQAPPFLVATIFLGCLLDQCRISLSHCIRGSSSLGGLYCRIIASMDGYFPMSGVSSQIAPKIRFEVVGRPLKPQLKKSVLQNKVRDPSLCLRPTKNKDRRVSDFVSLLPRSRLSQSLSLYFTHVPPLWGVIAAQGFVGVRNFRWRMQRINRKVQFSSLKKRGNKVCAIQSFQSIQARRVKLSCGGQFKVGLVGVRPWYSRYRSMNLSSRRMGSIGHGIGREATSGIKATVLLVG